jgi:serine/threonine protein kinase
VIGPYKLLQQLGEGGMGTVFMAEQEHPIRRKVALKVMKPGMDTKPRGWPYHPAQSEVL